MYKIKSYSEFIGEKNTVTESKKEIAGFKEGIEVVGLGKMKAKLDTGNTAYNAIIVQDYFEKNGKVKFNFKISAKIVSRQPHLAINRAF